MRDVKPFRLFNADQVDSRDIGYLKTRLGMLKNRMALAGQTFGVSHEHLPSGGTAKITVMPSFGLDPIVNIVVAPTDGGVAYHVGHNIVYNTDPADVVLDHESRETFSVTETINGPLIDWTNGDDVQILWEGPAARYVQTTSVVWDTYMYVKRIVGSSLDERIADYGKRIYGAAANGDNLVFVAGDSGNIELCRAPLFPATEAEDVHEVIASMPDTDHGDDPWFFDAAGDSGRHLYNDGTGDVHQWKVSVSASSLSKAVIYSLPSETSTSTGSAGMRPTYYWAVCDVQGDPSYTESAADAWTSTENDGVINASGSASLSGSDSGALMDGAETVFSASLSWSANFNGTFDHDQNAQTWSISNSFDASATLVVGGQTFECAQEVTQSANRSGNNGSATADLSFNYELPLFLQYTKNGDGTYTLERIHYVSYSGTKSVTASYNSGTREAAQTDSGSDTPSILGGSLDMVGKFQARSGTPSSFQILQRYENVNPTSDPGSRTADIACIHPWQKLRAHWADVDSDPSPEGILTPTEHRLESWFRDSKSYAHDAHATVRLQDGLTQAFPLDVDWQLEGSYLSSFQAGWSSSQTSDTSFDSGNFPIAKDYLGSVEAAGSLRHSYTTSHDRARTHSLSYSVTEFETSGLQAAKKVEIHSSTNESYSDNRSYTLTTNFGGVEDLGASQNYSKGGEIVSATFSEWEYSLGWGEIDSSSSTSDSGVPIESESRLALIAFDLRQGTILHAKREGNSSEFRSCFEGVAVDEMSALDNYGTKLDKYSAAEPTDVWVYPDKTRASFQTFGRASSAVWLIDEVFVLERREHHRYYSNGRALDLTSVMADDRHPLSAWPTIDTRDA